MELYQACHELSCEEMDSELSDILKAVFPSNRESEICSSSVPCVGMNNGLLCIDPAAKMSKQFHCPMQNSHGEMDICLPVFRRSFFIS